MACEEWGELVVGLMDALLVDRLTVGMFTPSMVSSSISSMALTRARRVLACATTRHVLPSKRLGIIVEFQNESTRFWQSSSDSVCVGGESI